VQTDRDGRSRPEDQVGDALGPGSKAKVGLYSNGQGTGLVLFACGRQWPPGTSSGDGHEPTRGLDQRPRRDTTLLRPREPDRPPASGPRVCTRGFWRRAVIVVGVSTPSLTLQSVARATDEAWDAQ
jgi:hypothetical protein